MVAELVLEVGTGRSVVLVVAAVGVEPEVEPGLGSGFAVESRPQIEQLELDGVAEQQLSELVVDSSVADPSGPAALDYYFLLVLLADFARVAWPSVA